MGGGRALILGLDGNAINAALETVDAATVSDFFWDVVPEADSVGKEGV